jgi:hypothetical protein
LRRYGEKKLWGLFCNFWKVARAKLEFIFENQGSSWNFCGLRLDFTEGQGANSKISGDFPAQIFFSMGKYGELGPPSMDRGQR